MGTRADCKAGEHTSDNQGLCWFCGTVVNPEWWRSYRGKENMHLKQPKRSKTFGQHCVAMMAGVPVSEVISRFGSGATSQAKILEVAAAFGLRQGSKLWVLNRDGELPRTGLLKMRKARRKYFHWACVIDGVLHDPSQDVSGRLAKCHEVVAFMPIEI
jgi:hypothetical protein